MTGREVELLRRGRIEPGSQLIRRSVIHQRQKIVGTIERLMFYIKLRRFWACWSSVLLSAVESFVKTVNELQHHIANRAKRYRVPETIILVGDFLAKDERPNVFDRRRAVGQCLIVVAA